jgi:hypothetical protein
MGIFQHTKVKERMGETVWGRQKLEIRQRSRWRRTRREKRIKSMPGQKDRFGRYEYGAASVAWDAGTVDGALGYF